jgi:uncharacterized protein YgbK (DUF1537 family)
LADDHELHDRRRTNRDNLSTFRIIADDLSGAADCGVAFAAHGHVSRVVLDDWGSPDDSDVVVVDLDTRDGDATSAAAAVRRIIADVPPKTKLVKKIDSTLRGHLSAELGAMREALAGRLLVVAPAFPRAGRITRGGVQHVHGLPLHRTEAWAMEAASAPRSIVEALGPLPACEVPVAPRWVLKARLAAAGAAGRVAVCDATNDTDLDALVAAASSLDVVWAGSAGLAAALARAQPGRRPSIAWTLAGARYLVVVGSATRVAARQAAELRGSGATFLELPRTTLERSDPVELGRLGEELAERVRCHNVVVTIGGSRATASAGAVRRAVAAVVASAAAEVSVLVLSGGATARALLDQLGIRMLELVAEPEPGVAVARAGSRYVVIKAGGFGDHGTLVRVLHEWSTA